MNDYLLTKMSVQDCIANLDNRVKLLESCYLTGGQQPELDAGSLLQRVQALLTKVQDIEAEFPEIKACSEALVKIQPLLGQKRHGLKSVQDKVNQLLAKKQTITEGVSLLQNIDGLQHVINTEQFAEAEAYKQQLDRIDQSLRGILPVIQQQSKEIDELLDIYEKSMLYVSKVCETWDLRLKAANK